MSERCITFIDGENLLLRFEAEFTQRRSKTEGTVYEQGRFVWHPNIASIHATPSLRVYYYTAAVGDEPELERLRRDLAAQHYHLKTDGRRDPTSVCPRVFKKERQSSKTKSIDINLTVDLLRAVHTRLVDRVVVVSGDGDYLPVYEEAMRAGVRVTVAALQSGLNPLIPPRVDYLHNLDATLFPQDAKG